MSFDLNVASVTVILRELDIPLSVSSKRDRIAMQKAIYLVQRRGVDLGFRYNWYLNGPYSPKLASVYYKADEERSQYAELTADGAFVGELSTAKDLINSRPDQINLTDWLEALVSIDFLVVVNDRQLEAAKSRVRELKPHVAGIVESAAEALIEKGFLPHAA